MRALAWRILLLSALAAVALIWGGEWLFATAQSRTLTLGTEVGPRWTRTALALAPFALLALYVLIRGPALSAQRVVRAWVTGAVLSLLLWGLYFIDPLLRPAGGANIGLGLLLMAAPLPLFAVMWSIARVRSTTA